MSPGFVDEHVVIPNDIVTGSSIVNRSRRGRLRIDVEVGIGYDADPDEAAEIAREAMAGVEAVAESPEPRVVLKRFGDSAVVLECRFYITDPTAEKRWEAQTAVIAAVSDAFGANGIRIPSPQRALKGREEAGGLELTGGAGVSAAATANGGQGDGAREDNPDEPASSERDGASDEGDESRDETTRGASE